MIINTGYKELDYIFKGFDSEKLYAIASRPGVGVTSFALNILLNLMVMNKRVLYISLKESEDKINQRLISIISGIRYKDDSESKNDNLSFSFASSILKNFNYSLKSMINGTIEDVYEYTKKEGSQIDIIFIDSLESFKYLEKSKIKNEILSIIKKLSELSKKLSIPIVILQALSKRIELRKNKIPRPTDLNYADITLDYFKNIIFIHKESYYKDSYNLVDRESAQIIVTDPKVIDYRMAYIEFIHNIQRFYSKIFDSYYVDYLINNSNHYIESLNINMNKDSKVDYKYGILECIKRSDISSVDKAELISLYKRWITISNYAFCDIIYLVRDK